MLDIAMPEVYVRAAQIDVLSQGEKLLAKASKIQTHYEPSIDAKVMTESGRTLREGMFMEITDEDVVDNTTDYILIDTLSIYEDKSAIPTYKVTLRGRRKVTYKGTPSATSSTDTESVSDGEGAEVDLTGYAKSSEVDARIAPLEFNDAKQDTSIAGILARLEKAEEITSLFGVDDHGIYTGENFRSYKEISAGGAGEEGESGSDTLDGLLDVEIGDMSDMTSEEKESQVVGFDDVKGIWVNKRTMHIHKQKEASAVWTVTHGLNKIPNVKVIDSTGELVFGTVKAGDANGNDMMNVVRICFGGVFAGSAYLD